MAGKKKLDTGPMLLPELDLDAIDDILDGDSKRSGKMTGKRAVTEFKSAGVKGFKGRVNSTATVRTFMRQALPDGYSRLFGLYDEVRGNIDHVKDTIEYQNAAELEDLSGKFEGQLDQLKDKLPEAVYNRIKDKLEDKKETYKLNRQIKQAQGKPTDPLADMDSGSATAVDEMFDELGEAQLDLSKATSDVDLSKLEYEVKRDGIRARLDKSRFDALNQNMGVIADATSRLTAFNDAITYRFQQKSLELQMRSYMALRSLVRLGGETHQLHKDAYTALVLNTGLADFQKGSEADRTKFNVKQSVLNPFKNQLNKTASDFAVNFLPQLFNNIGSKASGAIQGGSEAGSGLLGMLISQLRDDPANKAGNIAGRAGADWLLGHASPALARTVRPGIQKVSDKLTGGMDSRLSYGLDNMSSIAQEFVHGGGDRTGFMGYVQDAMRTVMPSLNIDHVVKDNTYQTIGQAASFNQLTQRSIVEIIPGYLSRILHETRMIRTGDDSVARESYDITRGQFAADTTSLGHLSKRIIGTGARRNMRAAMTSTLDTFDADETLSAEARHALEERLLRDAMEGRHFDPTTYVRPEGYANETTSEVLSELDTFFRERFKLDDSGKLIKDADNFRTRQVFSEQFNVLRDTATNPVKEIERLMKAGNHTALKDLGVIHTVEGEDRINYRALRQYYLDLGDDGEGGGIEPPSPTDPLVSRLRKDLRSKTEKTKAAFSRTKDKATEAFSKGREGFTENVEALPELFKTGTDSAKEHLKHVGDIVVTGTTDVLIRADEFLNGSLIDVNTQKVITSLDDITGEVKDRLGNTRITQAEAIKGLQTTTGQKLKSIKPSLKLATSVWSQIQQQSAKLGQRLTQPDGLLARVKDLYIEGINSPVIKASALRAGEYVNVATGEVVETIDDITDSIAHVSNPTEVILTREEASSKLVDSKGKRFKSSKLWRGITSVMGFGTNVVGKAFKLAFNVAKVGVRTIGRLLINSDAYLPGQAEPVLSVARLKRGEYYDPSGKVLTSFDDLRDGVYGPDGNIIVDADDIPQLVTRGGRKHTAAKKRSKIRKGIKKGVKALGGKWLNWTKNYYKGLGRVTGGIFKTLSKKSDKDLSAAITPTDSILTRILDTLDRRLPKEEARVGSTEWQLAQMVDGKKNADDDGKDTDDVKGPTGLGRIMAGLGGLFGGRGNQEEDDDDDGDTNVFIGGGDGERRDKKPKRPKKPRGRFGRVIDRAKRSKVGRGFGRFGKSGVGRGLGHAGRGALTLGRGALMMGGGSMLAGGGTMLAGAGGMLAGAGSAALAAGGAVLGVLASPVVLGALAVAAVAGAGFWLWRRYKKTSGDFRSLRLMQYGLSSKGDKLKVLKLEGYLEQYATKGPNPSLNLASADGNEILKLMGIKPDDSPRIMALARWLDLRFKPVFFSYLRAMDQHAGAEVLINDLDDKLDEGKKYAFIEAVSQIEPSVYLANETPFDFGEKTKVNVTPEDIHDKVNKIKRKWKDKAVEEPIPGGDTPQEEKETEAKETTPSSVAVAGGSAVAATMAAQGAQVSLDQPSTPKQAVSSSKGGNRFKKALAQAFKYSPLGVAKTVATGIGGTALAGLVGKGLVSAVPILGQLKTDKLTSLQAIRAHAYGELNLSPDAVGALFEGEARLFRDIRIDRNGQASYTGNLDLFTGYMANYMGVTLDESEESILFMRWVIYRYIPVALTYVAAAHSKYPGVTPSRIESALSDEDKAYVAKTIVAATYEHKGEHHPIWTAPTYSTLSQATLDEIRTKAEIEVEHLSQIAEKAKLATPTSTGNETEAESQNRLTTAATKLFSGAAAISANLRKRAADIISGVTDKVGGAVNRVKDWLGIGGRPQDTPVSTYSGDYTPGGELSQQGAVFTKIAEGKGGLWTTIPMPTQNKSRRAAMPTLRAVEQLTGVDAELLATFASIESSFDYLVKASTSSATGWFQFINATWDEQMGKHAAKYGIPSDSPNRDLRKDPRVNAIMGAEFLKGNYNYLLRRLGKTPTDTDLYCAHFMGAGGAVNFLSKDRNAIAASFFTKEAAANRSIYYKSTGQPRTIGEIYALFESKVAKHRRYNSDTNVEKSTTESASQAADDQAAKTMDTSDIETESGGGDVTQSNPTIDNSSIQSTADRAAGPMRSDVTGNTSVAGGTSSVVPSSDVTPSSPTVVTSGQNDPSYTQATELARQQAEQADRTAAATVRERQEVSSASINIQERQLETQIQMRDLLRIIANQVDRPGTANTVSGTETQRTGPTSNVAPPVRERMPTNQRPPISFDR